VARAAVFHVGDLPAGWAALPHDAANDDYRKIAGSFASCVGIDDVVIPLSEVVAHSADFASGGGARQAKSWMAVTTRQRSRTAVATYSVAQSAQCMTESTRNAFAEANHTSEVLDNVGTVVLPLPDVAVTSAALRTTIRLTVDGSPTTVYMDNVLLAHGELFGHLFFIGTDAPLDDAIESKLITAVAGRMAGA